jgi:purine nucleoside permease
VKKVPPEIITCDISSGRTYFTGKLYKFHIKEKVACESIVGIWEYTKIN